MYDCKYFLESLGQASYFLSIESLGQTNVCSVVCFPQKKSNTSRSPAVKHPLIIDIKPTLLYSSTILQNLILTNISCRTVHHAKFYFLAV